MALVFLLWYGGKGNCSEEPLVLQLRRTRNIVDGLANVKSSEPDKDKESIRGTYRKKLLNKVIGYCSNIFLIECIKTVYLYID